MPTPIRKIRVPDAQVAAVVAKYGDFSRGVRTLIVRDTGVGEVDGAAPHFADPVAARKAARKRHRAAAKK